jgi:outer membrane immunogenic protein
MVIGAGAGRRAFLSIEVDRGIQMKKFALIAASFALAGTASAADLRRPLPVKAPAPVVVAAYNWTGCYVGGGGGYGMWNQRTTTLTDPAGVAIWTPVDHGGDGWFGTVQVGCDYQVTSNIVIGAFGDYDFSGMKGDVLLGGGLFWSGEEKLKSSWAAGGRIGWVPFQASQLLVYVSGGYTQARFDAVNLFQNGVALNQVLQKNTYDGWFIGTGYEYGIGFLPGLFWKTEYRFADYGNEHVRILTTAGAPTGFQIDSEKKVHTVRSELVWRFNFGGPVVARY